MAAKDQGRRRGRRLRPRTGCGLRPAPAAARCGGGPDHPQGALSDPALEPAVAAALAQLAERLRAVARPLDAIWTATHASSLLLYGTATGAGLDRGAAA